MSLIRQAVKVVSAFFLVFTFAFSNLNAAAFPNSLAVSAGNKVKGTLERAEGKAEEAIGNLRGDKEAQIKGKVKQAEGQIRSTPGTAHSEDEVIGKTQQAESNIRRYQSDEYQTSNPTQAVQY